MDTDRGYSAQASKLLPLDATQQVYSDPPRNVKARFSLNETAPCIVHTSESSYIPDSPNENSDYTLALTKHTYTYTYTESDFVYAHHCHDPKPSELPI